MWTLQSSHAGQGGRHGRRVTTVAFVGIEARRVDVQVQVVPGIPAFSIVGLPDKAVAESRERVRAALTAVGLALPPRRITVNLAPADLPKEGSHFDAAIALGLMAAIGAVPHDALSGWCVVRANSRSTDGSRRSRACCPPPSAQTPWASGLSVRPNAARKRPGRAPKWGFSRPPT